MMAPPTLPPQPYPDPGAAYSQPYPQALHPPPYPYPPQAYPPPPPYPYPPVAPQVAAPSPVKVQDYSFSDFNQGQGSSQEMPANIDLVMDVPVVVTVELGRTKRKIKEILEFGTGTIVELDKQAGSHVDVICNGQLIARGDVVVVDDNFSIRVTEILKSRDSLTML